MQSNANTLLNWMSNICFYARGIATLGNKLIGAMKEPDESYNFGT